MYIGYLLENLHHTSVQYSSMLNTAYVPMHMAELPLNDCFEAQMFTVLGKYPMYTKQFITLVDVQHRGDISLSLVFSLAFSS